MVPNTVWRTFTAAKERQMRRHLRKLLFGVGTFIILTPTECTFLYCDRHSFQPPICEIFFIS